MNGVDTITDTDAAAGQIKQAIRGDRVQQGLAQIDAALAAEQPGFFKRGLGSLGRSVTSLANVGLVPAAIAGQPGAAEALAMSEQVRNWLPANPALPRFQRLNEQFNEPGVGGFFRNLQGSLGAAMLEPEAALGTTLESVIPSLVTTAAGATVGGVVGGPGGVIVGGGVGSGAQDFTSEFLDAFRQAGVDTTNPAAMAMAFRSPQTMTAARAAAAHAIPVGVFDALSMGVAGKLFKAIGATNALSSVGKKAFGAIAEAAQQMGTAATGETLGQAAQIATGDRQKLDIGSITLEALGELVQAAPETALSTGLRGDRRSPVTLDTIEAWAAANPDKAAALAQSQPTRSAFDAAGLPRVTEAQRAALWSKLKELTQLAATETPTPTPTQPDPTPLSTPGGGPAAADLTEPPTGDTPSQGPAPSAAEQPAPTLPTAPQPAAPLSINQRAQEILDAGEADTFEDAQQQAGMEIAAAIRRQKQTSTPPAAPAPDIPPSQSTQPAQNDAATVSAPIPIFRYGDGNIAKKSANGAEHPRTGEPVTAKVYRGYGRKNLNNPKVTGGRPPVFGPGYYYSFEKKQAQRFGPTVEEQQVTIQNPLVITSVQELSDLSLAATGKPANAQSIVENPRGLADLADWAVTQGHDGIVVSVPSASHSDNNLRGANAKRLRDIFDQSQVFIPAAERPQGSTPKPDSGSAPAASAGPSVPAVATPKGYFTKTDLENRILEVSGLSAAADATARGLEERTGTDLRGRIGEDQTFDIGADAAATLRGMRAAESQGRARLGRDYAAAINQAKRSMRTSPDPQARFYAALHDNLPLGRLPRKIAATPSSLPVGATFKINGEQFQVVPSSEGFNVLKDGQDFPIVPVDALDTIPIDKGTLGTAPVTETVPADQIMATRRNTSLPPDTSPTRGRTPQLPPTQRVLMGNPIAEPATGSQRDLITATEGSTPATSPARSGVDAAIAGRYDEQATPTLESSRDSVEADLASIDETDLPNVSDLPTPDDGIAFRSVRDGPVGPKDSYRGATPPVPSIDSARPKVVSASWLTRWLSTKFEVPILYGEVKRRKVGGFYDAYRRYVRIRGEGWGNIWLGMHEVAHHIDDTNKVVNGLSWTAKAELGALDYEPSKARPFEGFAEYLARWALGDDAALQREAPAFTAEFFGPVLAKDAVTKAKLEAFREHVKAYFAQDPKTRLRSAISATGKAEIVRPDTAMAKVRQKVANVYRQMRLLLDDDGYDVMTLDKDLADAGAALQLSLEDNYRVAHAEAASSGAEAFMNGVYFLSEGPATRRGPGFNQIMEALGDEKKYDDFVAFAVARHDLALQDRGLATPFRREDSQVVYNQFKDDANIVRAANLFVKMNNRLVLAFAEAKLISRKAAKAMLTEHGSTYVPMIKVKEGLSDTDTLAAGLHSFGSTPFRRLRGSAAQIVDPVAATAWRFQSAYQNLHRQDFVTAVLDATRATPGMGKWVRPLPTGTTATSFTLAEIRPKLEAMGLSSSELDAVQAEIDAGNADGVLQIFRPDYASKLKQLGIVSRWEGPPNNQELRFYELDGRLVHAAQSIAPFMDVDPFIKLSAAVTSITRAGAVPLNLGFLLTNLVRDYQTQLAQGQGTIGQRVVGPFAEIGKRVADVARIARGYEPTDETRHLFESMRGNAMTKVGYKPDAARIKDTLTGTPSTLAGKARRAKQALYAVNEEIEAIPRLAAFRWVLESHGFDNKALRSGRKVPKHVLYQAYRAAAESTVDFSRTGRWKSLSKVLLFANAIIQSNTRFLRNFSDAENRRRALPAMALQMAATIAYWLAVKDEAWWKNTDKKIKYTSYIFGAENGQPLAKIPMSYETGAYLSGSLLAMLDSIQTKQPLDFLRYLMQTAGRNTTRPALLAPAIDVYANWDSFRDRAIVPEGLQRAPAYQQYNPSTTATMRWLGRQLDASPAKLEFLADGYTGGLYRRAAKLIESPITGEPLTLRDVPFISQVTFGGEPDGSRPAFYDLKQTAEVAAAIAEDGGRTTGPEFDRLHELNRYAEIMASVRRETKDVRGRDARFAFDKYMIGLARRATGQEELPQFPDPIRHPTSSPIVEKAVKTYLEREAMQATAPMPLRQNNETAAVYKARVDEWAMKRERSRALLRDTDRELGDIRDLLVERFRRTGSSARMTPSGQPTALGQRLQRLQAVKK